MSIVRENSNYIIVFLCISLSKYIYFIKNWQGKSKKIDISRNFEAYASDIRVFTGMSIGRML